jgi:hypothetical protein
MFQGPNALLSKLFSNRVKALTHFELAYEELTNDGAASVILPVTYLIKSSTGAKAVTLANGTYEGQVKFITMMTYTSSGATVVTPANFADGTTISFDAVGEGWVGIYHAGQWYTLAINGATIA